MFTGLVQAKGTVRSAAAGRLTVATSLELSQGDSVAVGGVCLTAVDLRDGEFSADVMDETLSRTSLGRLGPGDEVNLELPLRAGDPMGGHVVQGHVDGIGAVAQGPPALRIEADPGLLRYVVEKGSIAIDGVSLTVTGVNASSFSVGLIPETLDQTTLGGLGPADTVNLEVDILAKHVEKLIRDR